MEPNELGFGELLEALGDRFLAGLRDATSDVVAQVPTLDTELVIEVLGIGCFALVFAGLVAVVLHGAFLVSEGIFTYAIHAARYGRVVLLGYANRRLRRRIATQPGNVALSLRAVRDSFGRGVRYEVTHGGSLLGYLSVDTLEHEAGAIFKRWESRLEVLKQTEPGPELNEALIPGSQIETHYLRPHPSLCVFYAEEDGFKPIGNGFRVDDYIVTPAHVMEQAKYWGLPFSVKRFPVENFKVFQDYDFAFRLYDQATFASVGLKMAPLTKSVSHHAHVRVCGYCPDEGWVSSSGPVKDSTGERYEMTYKASTRSGMSGSMVLHNGRLVGMHLRATESDNNVFLGLHWLSYRIAVRDALCNKKAERPLPQSDVLNESTVPANGYYADELRDLSWKTRRIVEDFEQNVLVQGKDSRQARWEFLQHHSTMMEFFLSRDDLEDFLETGEFESQGSQEFNKLRSHFMSARDYHGYNESAAPEDVPSSPREEGFRPGPCPLSGTATDGPGETSGTPPSTSLGTTSQGAPTLEPRTTVPTPDSLESGAASDARPTPVLLKSELQDLKSLLSSLQSSVDKFSTSHTPQGEAKRGPTQNTSPAQESLPSRKRRSKKRPAKSPASGPGSN
jgi:hypothetical protein